MQGNLRVAAGLGVLFLIGAALADGLDAQAAQKKKTGSTTGAVASKKSTPDGKDFILEIKAPGEETARKYWVDREARVREALKGIHVGDQVKVDWYDSGEGPIITKFEVLKRAAAKDEKKDK